MFRFEHGQILQGRKSTYTIAASLRDKPGGPWLATDVIPARFPSRLNFLSSNTKQWAESGESHGEGCTPEAPGK
jgi:hypothetical protein